MPQIPLTSLCLALLVAALLLLRSRWYRLRRRTRQALFTFTFVAIAIFVYGYATKWVTTSDRLNCGIYWAAVAGYLLLLAIHSLNRPRWLTSLSAVILAVPLLSSSLFIPLTQVFDPDNRRVQPLGHNIYVSWLPFVEAPSTNSGTDLDISYRPRLLPFLRHSRLGGRFYDALCNSAATEVRLQPDANSVFIRCPPWPGSGEINPGAVIHLH